MLIVSLFLCVCVRPQTLRAQILFTESFDDDAATFEAFSGIDATSSSIFGYAGAAWSLGNDVGGEGPRVKVLAGSGLYVYDGSLAGFAGPVNFNGEVMLARVLAGYLWRRGEWTAKAYAGLGYEDHDLSPNDPGNSVNGNEIGLVGEVELWRNLGAAGFLSLDAGYADVFDTYRAHARFGRRIMRHFSAGIEGAALGNEEYESGRGGGFLRIHLEDMDLTFSGGVAGDFYTQDLGGYAAFGLYTRF